MAVESPAWGRLGGALGVLSFATLVASAVWVHHWSVRSDAIVAVWAVATVGAFGVSRRSLRQAVVGRGWARLGLSLAVVSFLALAVAGIAWAAGTSISGACGGG